MALLEQLALLSLLTGKVGSKDADSTATSSFSSPKGRVGEFQQVLSSLLAELVALTEQGDPKQGELNGETSAREGDALLARGEGLTIGQPPLPAEGKDPSMERAKEIGPILDGELDVGGEGASRSPVSQKGREVLAQVVGTSSLGGLTLAGSIQSAAGPSFPSAGSAGQAPPSGVSASFSQPLQVGLEGEEGVDLLMRLLGVRVALVSSPDITAQGNRPQEIAGQLARAQMEMVMMMEKSAAKSIGQEEKGAQVESRFVQLRNVPQPVVTYYFLHDPRALKAAAGPNPLFKENSRPEVMADAKRNGSAQGLAVGMEREGADQGVIPASKNGQVEGAGESSRPQERGERPAGEERWARLAITTTLRKNGSDEGTSAVVTGHASQDASSAGMAVRGGSNGAQGSFPLRTESLTELLLAQLAELSQRPERPTVSQLRLELHPPELGELRAELHLHREGLELRLITPNGQARELLASQAAGLREALAQHYGGEVRVIVQGQNLALAGGMAGWNQQNGEERQGGNGSARLGESGGPPGVVGHVREGEGDKRVPEANLFSDPTARYI